MNTYYLENMFQDLDETNSRISRQCLDDIVKAKNESCTYMRDLKLYNDYDINFINKYEEILFNKDIAIIVLDYISNLDNKRYYNTYICQRNKRENNFLNEYKILNINDYDIKANDIISNSKDFSILIFNNDYFYSFVNWINWYAPIEYYLNHRWIIDNRWWVYTYINDMINNEFKNDLEKIWYKSIYISNKEKWGEWRFENIYLVTKDDDFISINNIKDISPLIYYKVYFVIDNYIRNYKKEFPLSSIEDENEWKRAFY